MKKIIVFLFICSIFATKAQNIAEYNLKLSNFTELNVTDNVNVVYHSSEDSTSYAHFACIPDVSSHILFTQDKAKLHIQVDFTEISAKDVPTVHVYSPALTKVENAGDSTITITPISTTQPLKIRIVGNGGIVVEEIEATQIDAGINTGKGHINLSGTTSKLKLSNVGTGAIEAGNLYARTVKVVQLGTGNIDCRATESISIYGAGSGTVYYTGHPEKVSNRSLGIKAVEISDQ